MSEWERDRQTDRKKRTERRGGGLRGPPSASSNLWHGKKKELAPSRVCVHNDQRAQQPSAIRRTL